MATVNKDFRVKNGLVVEGTTGTIDGNNIITDGDTTDVLDEGSTNLYYTDQRVRDEILNSQQTNISITEYDGQLVFETENGVEDSTTDDLEEGETNLYYTDERARESISGGDGISYESTTGEISADLGDGLGIDAEDKIEVVTGNGLEIGENGEVQIDTTIIVDVDSTQTLSNKELGTDLDADNFQIINLGTPQNSDDAATKAYVDAVAEGLHVHASVETATDENIALSPAPSTIDGVTLTTGMRVLVKDQSSAVQNGIYVLDSEGNLVRAEDHDTADEVQAGDFVFVSGGTIYGATGWVQTNTVNALGTDPIEWTQFSGAGTFLGGTGIDINGQDISIDFSEFDTDDIDEGDANLYYTDQRVRDVLTSSSQTNISITEYDQQLIITAENGVADSTTNELEEGDLNLYFTDQRAVDALEAVVPNFTEIEINSVSKQVAVTTMVTTAETPTVVYDFDKSEYRSAKFLVKAASGSHTQISEVLITLDTSDNVAITEYAIVSSNGILIDVTAAEATGDVQIIVEAANSNTTVTIFGTLIV